MGPARQEKVNNATVHVSHPRAPVWLVPHTCVAVKGVLHPAPAPPFRGPHPVLHPFTLARRHKNCAAPLAAR